MQPQNYRHGSPLGPGARPFSASEEAGLERGNGAQDYQTNVCPATRAVSPDSYLRPDLSDPLAKVARGGAKHQKPGPPAAGERSTVAMTPSPSTLSKIDNRLGIKLYTSRFAIKGCTATSARSQASETVRTPPSLREPGNQRIGDKTASQPMPLRGS